MEKGGKPENVLSDAELARVLAEDPLMLAEAQLMSLKELAFGRDRRRRAAGRGEEILGRHRARGRRVGGPRRRARGRGGDGSGSSATGETRAVGEGSRAQLARRRHEGDGRQDHRGGQRRDGRAGSRLRRARRRSARHRRRRRDSQKPRILVGARRALAGLTTSPRAPREASRRQTDGGFRSAAKSRRSGEKKPGRERAAERFERRRDEKKNGAQAPRGVDGVTSPTPSEKRRSRRCRRGF